MKLYKELGLKKDFDVLPHEVILSIYYTVTRLKQRAQDFFKNTSTTDVQFNVLMLLFYQAGDKGGLTQAELSRMMLVNRANITTLIDRMEKAGLVERSSLPGDRRFNVIKLTDQGMKSLSNLEDAYMKEVAAIMNALEESELIGLLESLGKIRDKLRD